MHEFCVSQGTAVTFLGVVDRFIVSQVKFIQGSLHQKLFTSVDF